MELYTDLSVVGVTVRHPLIFFVAFANIQHQGSLSSVTSSSAYQQPAIHKSGTSGEVDRVWSVVFRHAFVKIWESVQAAPHMQACYNQEGIEECPTFNVIFISNYFNGVFKL